MPGSSPRRGLVLQPRDRHLLTELARLRVVDREQARLVGGFQSLTRINTRLLALCRAGLLVRMTVGTVRGGHKFLYSLSRHGAHVVGQPFRAVPFKTDTVLAGNLFLEHQLRINALYFELAYQPIPIAGVRMQRWLTFQRPIAAPLPLIPDAYVEFETPNGMRVMFVEMDLGTESQRIWRRKTQMYLQLAVSGVFTARFHHPQFRVLVIVPSERRLQTVRATVRALTTKIFWFATFDIFTADALWTASWRRADGDHWHLFL
jgi:hypothetical protein